VRAIAINVGANTNEPGFRGPVYPDGRFEFVPIPEPEPAEGAPTYGDLAPHLGVSIPEGLRDTPVHLDPEFPEHPCCERYTYGDEHGVKAGPLADLSAGDHVFFYATLSVRDGDRVRWLPSEWGAFLIGQFRLARDPVTGEEYRDLPPAGQEPFANNAHVRRDPVDARVFLLGDPDGSCLYDRCVPLSRPAGGTEPNALVTRLSADSGRGPWWRRPLRFDGGTAELLRAVVDSARDGLAGAKVPERG
jgi:hypothetical protein